MEKVRVTKDVVLQILQGTQVDLKSTHDKLCIPIINRIYIKMLMGIKFPPIKVVDGLIIDGHHRYIASHLAKFNLEVVPYQSTCATVTTDWLLVDFTDEDWDTPAKINILNLKDARYNDIAVEYIIKMLE